MSRSCLRTYALVSLVLASLIFVASAPAGNPSPAQEQKTLEIQGKIIRTAPDQFIVQTREDKQVKVFLNPQTKFTMNNKPFLYSDLKLGSSINMTYTIDGTRWVANTVVVVPAAPPGDRPPPQKSS